jgi:hypothetical protein
VDPEGLDDRAPAVHPGEDTRRRRGSGDQGNRQ